MHRAFSFPVAGERSRYKERLEASLAGLLELEVLKERQEGLVLGALALGDSGCGRPTWGLLRRGFSLTSARAGEQSALAEQQQVRGRWFTGIVVKLTRLFRQCSCRWVFSSLSLIQSQPEVS